MHGQQDVRCAGNGWHLRQWHACMCAQLKGVLMAVYFGADHVVWAGQAGLVSDKQLLER